MAAWSPFWVALGAALAMMTLVWLASLVMRDASIIDVFWGLGFVVVAWIYLAARETRTLRSDVVVGLVTLWGTRLSLHILWRGRGKGEDYRYREMRERNPGTFPFRSLVTVFWLQAVLLWAISAPLFQAQRGAGPAGLAPLDVLGLALFALGFVFEAGATGSSRASSATRTTPAGSWTAACGATPVTPTTSATPWSGGASSALRRRRRARGGPSTARF
jgi:steroid 5-alpha reductase family enzyme